MNPLDSFIAALSPQAALKREAARVRLDALRRYEGASRGRRTDGWLTSGTSADAASSAARKTLRDRSRDLVRNNPYAAKAVQVLVSNVIGTGIVGQAKAKRSRRRSQQLTDLYLDWANDPRQCDFHGRLDFVGLQALAFRTVVESGEVLIVRRSPQGDQRIPLQIQIIEPDYLDASRDGLGEDGRYTREGIVHGVDGRRLGYWLYREHPGETHIRSADFGSEFIEASQVIHVFRQDRPGQNRGVPWASPIVLRLRDFDDYADAQLLKQKISACFTAFAVDTEAPDAGMGVELIDKLEPGAIEILPPGKDIRFANPPSVGEFDKVSREYLLQIAAGFGITYEALTGDLSATNFSSARLGWLEFQRNIEAWRWQMLVPQMLNPIWSWFVSAAGVASVRMDGIVVQWTPPKREQIDPTTEIKAKILETRAGLMSMPEAIRENGYEPDVVLQEIAEFNQMADALGVILDTDPRKVSSAGLTQARPVGSVYPPTGEPPEEAEQPASPRPAPQNE